MTSEVNFLKAIKLNPFFLMHYNLGNVYYKKMDYERSAHYLKRSIKQNNNSSMAFHNRNESWVCIKKQLFFTKMR